MEGFIRESFSIIIQNIVSYSLTYKINLVFLQGINIKRKYMKPITQEEIKNLLCDLLQDVADFCEESGIRYCLAYGTLIGAIRHNGFIPWDDDIDIVMPRPDYDRFLRTYNNRQSNKRVIDISIDKDYGIPYAKVYDNRTWLNEYKYREEKYGVFIDIFPIDGIKGNWQMYKAQVLMKLLHAKKANFVQRSLVKNIINSITKIFLLPFSVYDILSFMNHNARSVPFGSTPKAVNFLETYGICEIAKTAIFEKTLFHEFEGKRYRIPAAYDEWLRSIYGDYMQLPPEEKQVTHHIYDVYWKDDD